MNPRIDRIKIIEQAERYVKAGRLKEAIAEYERLSSTDPDDVGTLNIIGDLSVQVGQPEKAVKCFRRVAEEYEKRGLFSQALAIRKKIYKITPDNLEHALNLADLYGHQGFLADAKTEYLKVAERYIKERNIQEAVHVFEKAVKLDREDLDMKRALAGLYREQGFTDAALEQLNEIAEARLAQQAFQAAEEVLTEALALRPGDVKTIVNLIESYKRRDQVGKAVELIEENLKADPGNVQLLNLLGNFHFEAGDIKKAEEVFLSIIDGHPMNVNARIKLGRIEILKDSLDQAFELFEPLINNLIKKHRHEKAIGLLGLILETQKPHLPALELLASIYRDNKEDKKLEVVVRAVLDELRRRGEKEKMIPVLAELRRLRPDDAEIAEEAKTLRSQMGLPPDETQSEDAKLSAADREAIEETLSQADLYMQQGLVRNARRILENLRFRYPDNHRIMKKIAVLDEIRTHIDEDELRRRVEKATAMESRAKDKAAGQPVRERQRASGAFPSDALEGDKVSTADIFAETDIIPFVAVGSGQVKYRELGDQIAAELRMLKAVHAEQTQGTKTQEERELSNIVTDFRNDLKTRQSAQSGEMRFQLGIAFMDQGLYAEAIEELSQAAKDTAVAVDAYTAISRCYRQKRNFADAERWLRKAQALAKEGTDQHFALEYELAELCEYADHKERALSLFKGILGWNPSYRNAALKVTLLESRRTGQPA
jgi:tetratricopeptide (TPR) repeat protein